jgi:drug/metabolite transporter (DMT)-like permease
MNRMGAYAFIGGYVVLLGIATFLQKPALKTQDALQLNALTGIGLAAVSVAALAVGDRLRFPALESAGAGLGIGIMMGLGSLSYYLGLRYLPVSVAAPLAITYIAIPVVLSILFLHEPISVFKIAGIVLTVAGVLLLSTQA